MNSRRFDRNAKLSCSRLEIGTFFEFKDVGRTEGMVSDRSHGDHLTTSSELEVKRKGFMKRRLIAAALGGLVITGCSTDGKPTSESTDAAGTSTLERSYETSLTRSWVTEDRFFDDADHSQGGYLTIIVDQVEDTDELSEYFDKVREEREGSWFVDIICGNGPEARDTQPVQLLAQGKVAGKSGAEHVGLKPGTGELSKYSAALPCPAA